MSTNLLIFPKFRAFDVNGDPLSGGKLYSYAAGTTDALATYTTRAGNVANANPVILDANGEARVWLAPGVDYKLELQNSAGVIQWTEDNIPSPGEEDTTGDVTTEPGGRLSLTSATPVTTSDVTGATTVYYVPYKHNRIPLFDGTSWAVHEIATELSQTTADNTKSPAAVTTDSNYDLFIWDDDGTLRISRGPVWTDSTGGTQSRGTGAGTTELERVNGRLVNKVSISNGPAAQCGLFVGSVRSDGSSQLNDSLAKRNVRNVYNFLPRPLKKLEATNTWTYGTNTYRQANASAANQVEAMFALAEDAIDLRLRAHGGSTSAGNATVAIGVDSTSVASAAGLLNWGADAAGFDIDACAEYVDFPGLGGHFFAWLEKVGTGTTTFYGDGGADVTYGLTGRILG